MVGVVGFFFLRFTLKNALWQDMPFKAYLPRLILRRCHYGFESTVQFIKIKLTLRIQGEFWFYMVGVVGFEPTDGGFRVPCLTTWRHSSVIGWDCMERVWFCKFIFLMIDNVFCRYQESLFWVSVIL